MAIVCSCTGRRSKQVAVEAMPLRPRYLLDHHSMNEDWLLVPIIPLEVVEKGHG